MSRVEKNTLSQIFLLAHQQYKEWLLNGKQLVVLVILFFVMQNVSRPLFELSKEVGVPLQWTETFLSAVNTVYMIPLILFCFITLMSEFPKRNYEDINLIFRTSRSNWYFGQLIFSIYAILTFLVELASLFLVRAVSVSYHINGWSPITKNYMEKYLQKGQSFGVVAVVPAEIFNHFAPNTVFAYTLLLLASMLLEMNLIMFICNLLNKRTMGIVVNILFIVLGVGMLYINSDYLKFLPLGNAVLKCQNLPAIQLTERYQPICYFLVINSIFIILGRFIIKKVRL